MTIAVHTLGCRVNQYDTQAMLELFQARGYVSVPFSSDADVYLINTCTVTGTGDRKSLQLARRVRREHPSSALILCGCLSQRLGQELLSLGPRLILGTGRRSEVVDLLEQSLRENTQICAVSDLSQAPFENLAIHRQEDHTRADLKIQEGCNNHCTYCIIPSVRGPIRSRTLEDIADEAARLTRSGYRELVITGIHLTSYGMDQPDRPSLLDALRTIQAAGPLRIRLGSLEPVIATPSFAEGISRLPAVCPQFHLALQSGSDAVLHAMRRRYNVRQYRASVAALRAVFPDCAMTTDILTGFPGETEANFEETRQFVHEIGFARIHVFPFSPREGTPAALMPDQVPNREKERRASLLIEDGLRTAAAYRASMEGKVRDVLLETFDGVWHGYTPEYIPVAVKGDYQAGQVVSVRLGPGKDAMTGTPVSPLS